MAVGHVGEQRLLAFLGHAHAGFDHCRLGRSLHHQRNRVLLLGMHALLLDLFLALAGGFLPGCHICGHLTALARCIHALVDIGADGLCDTAPGKAEHP